MPGEAYERHSLWNEVTGFLRPLGAAERFFHLYARVYPVHFCLCAEIVGSVSAEELRSALNQVRERHPILRARIVSNRQLGTAFRKSDRPIELKTIYGGMDADWRLIVERELQMPMEIETYAPLRVTALRTPKVTAVVLTFHHAFADGMSAVWVLHDILRALAGEQLEAFRSFPSIDEKILGNSPTPAGADEPGQIWPTLPETQTASAVDLSNLKTNIDTAEFSKEETTGLIERCKANGTTVHNIICAVAARHFPVSGEDIVRITCPFDVRKIAGIESGACGVFICSGSAEVQIKETTSIWHDAHRIGDSLTKGRSPEVVIEFISQMSAEFSPTTRPEKFLAFLSTRPQTALVVSNLGVLPIAEQYGAYVVKAVWGPALLTNLPEDRQTIGVCTFGGRLRIVHQSYVPIRGLASSIRNTLIAA